MPTTAAVEVDQRPARVAGVDRCVGLHGEIDRVVVAARAYGPGRVADTMPLVTDSERPRGAPAATTVWPTTNESDLAKVAGLRFATPSTLITARSLVSRGTDDRRLGDRTVVERDGDGALLLFGRLTTWSLVRM